MPAVGVGGRTELEPSQARQAGVDQLCDTATPGASRPREGSQVQLPRLLVTQEPGASPLCVCVCVWLGSYETKLILRYLIPTTTYIYIGLPQPFFYTWLKTMTYIYLFFILLQITCLRSQRLWSCLRFTSSPICFNIAAVCTSSLCWNSCATNAPRFPSEDSM